MRFRFRESGCSTVAVNIPSVFNSVPSNIVKRASADLSAVRLGLTADASTNGRTLTVAPQSSMKCTDLPLTLRWQYARTLSPFRNVSSSSFSISHTCRCVAGFDLHTLAKWLHGFAACPARLSVGQTAFLLAAELTVAVHTSAAVARCSSGAASTFRRRSSAARRRRRWLAQCVDLVSSTDHRAQSTRRSLAGFTDVDG